ncbi:MAG: hypothetical protein FVQ82_14690 [Planctomycetes bacterium]|nr:hypothetical protein [Planctomycetota bacterium]
MDQDDLKLEPLEPYEPENNAETDIPAPPEAITLEEKPEKKTKVPAGPAHVLPAKRYKLKSLLMFMDLIAIVVFIYFLMIRSILRDINAKTFSFGSNQMFAFYCVVAITLITVVILCVFKLTKSAQTRFARSNEVRQNPNIKVWLTGFDWGWPIMFLPTMTLMFAAGIIGVILNKVMSSSGNLPVIQNVIGGVVLVIATLNAAVVIFKLKPVVLGLLTGSVFVILLIMLLHGQETFLGFFGLFKHVGINIEPKGYILLAYVWSVFLRIIWIKSLFFYWVFLPNRLEMQHGLSESNDSIDRDDLRHKIDTDDVILRWWNVGIITFYFPELDRLPITNVVWGIRKKAVYANRIASVKTMSD